MSSQLYEDNEKNIALLQELLRLGLTIVSEITVHRATDWVTSVYATDIDDDGDIEVIFGSRDGMVRVLTSHGDMKWKYAIDSGWRQWIGTVAGLTYRNCKTCVITGSRDGSICAFDKSGELLWRASATDVVRQVLLGDINNDGRIEVVAASEDFWLYAFDYETGKEVWKCSTQGWIRAISFCDIDGDDEIEVLAGSGDKSIYVISGRTGQNKQIYPIKQKTHALYAYDVDQDGSIEVLIGTDRKDLYALKANGQEKWRMHPAPDNRILSLHVADINNDGRNEIIAASEDMHIYFLDDQGQLLWRHYLGSRPMSIYAVDLDRDGFVEILVGAQDNRLHVLRMDLTENLKALRTKIISCYKFIEDSPLLSRLSQTESALLQDIVHRNTHEHHVTVAHAKRVLRSQNYEDALSILLRLKHQHVQPLWKKSKNIGLIRSLSFENIESEAQSRLIIGTDEGEIQVLNPRGDLLWSRPLPDQRIVMLQMGDLDGDGVAEVIACTYNRRVYVLNSSGKFSGKPMQEWVTCIYVSRYSQGDQLCTEIVMGSRDNKITICNSQLETLEIIPTPQRIKMICTYDLNDDGIPEIIAGTFDEYVYAYSRDGNNLWQYRTWDRVNTLCIKDIDADGFPEIVVGSEDRNVHVLDSHGHLKWRYYTPHRVINIDVCDVNLDGEVEVLIGNGDGYMYVLNGRGDLLWKYLANDRIRVVQAQDINNDGQMEIALGSEDRLNLLQPIPESWVEEQTEQCWLTLQGEYSTRDYIAELQHHPDASLRAFALEKLARLPDLHKNDLKLFMSISKEGSLEERIVCAEVLPLFYQICPPQAQQVLTTLAIDPAQEVQLALLNSLLSLATIDAEVSFGWLQHFTLNNDRWVLRTCICALSQLVSVFPEKAFPLLVSTAQHETTWAQQESARALAHYCDLYPTEVVSCAFTLLSRKIQPVVFQQIAYSSNKSFAQRLFQVLVDMMVDLDSTTFVTKLGAAVQTIGEARMLAQGKVNWQLYNEFYRAGKLQTINEIVQYSVNVEKEHFVHNARLARALEYLTRLSSIARMLQLYLKRETLLDRLTSLLDVDEALKRIASDLGRESSSTTERMLQGADRQILQLIISQWANCVTKELSRLRGKADLHITVERRLVQTAEHISIPLVVRNSGHSPADHVELKLRKSSDFTVIGHNTYTFDTISPEGLREISFTIKPFVSSLHFIFELQYTDADVSEKVLTHSERIEIQPAPHLWVHIRNPYNSGTPIRDNQMFYGRDEDLRILREKLIDVDGNSVVVLSGQRRSGKTSLLYQLIGTEALQPHIPVFIDMHGEGMEFTPTRFFSHMAQFIYRTLKNHRLTISPPDTHAIEEDPSFAFRLFLEDVGTVLDGRKLILLIDEFEILEEKMKMNGVAQEISKYFRNLMQHGHGTSFLLSGTRKIHELTGDYWSILFNIARQHQLSPLSERNALQLITEPVQQTIQYDTSALREIRQLTGDQPYFIHLLCGHLVDYCNEMEQNYVMLSDIHTALDKVLKTCHNHFTWMWNQLPEQAQRVLSAMVEAVGSEDRPVSLMDIEDVYQYHVLAYDEMQVLQAIEYLIREEIVEGVVAGEVTEVASSRMLCHIPVGLARLWLQKNRPLKK
jgi:outer membrane protein assembly factor BamB